MTASQAHLDLGFGEPGPVRRSAETRLPQLAAAREPGGVVYTQPWVVDLILDLAGYRADQDLAARYVVEPSAGKGAFLVPMIRRLLASLAAHGRI
jgi:adenine-specific DNA-methyltransferase